MSLRAEQATSNVLICDSLPFSMGGTATIAAALAAENVACLIGYLGAITPERVEYLTDAGIAFMAVTYGTTPEHYDGNLSVSQAKALGYPQGASIFLDVEGLAAFHTNPSSLKTAIDEWGKIVSASGFRDAGYIGVPQPFTSDELFSLHVSMYWHGQGEVRDRFNKFANPTCGWSMRQKYPSEKRGGIWVDDNTIKPDDFGRLPYWAVKDE